MKYLGREKKRKYIIAIIAVLVAVLGLGVGVPVETQAKTATIAVKKADTDTAKKLDRQLRKGKKFQVKVKGDPKAAKKILNKLNKKIQKVNSYSVLMQSEQGKTSKGYTLFKISADNAKLYTYTIALLKDMYKNSFIVAIQAQEEKVNRSVDSLEHKCDDVFWDLEYLWVNITEDFLHKEMDAETVERVAEIENVTKKIYGSVDFGNIGHLGWKLVDPYAGDPARLEMVAKNILDSEEELRELDIFQEDDWKWLRESYTDFQTGSARLLKMKEQKEKNRSRKFCSLSTCLQAQIITEKFNYYRYEYMSYSFDRNSYPQKSKWIKALLNRKARGVCEDFTRCQMIIFEQIGIPSHYTSGPDHALVTVKVKNASKKTIWLCCDYGNIYHFKDVKKNGKSIYWHPHKNWTIIPSAGISDEEFNEKKYTKEKNKINKEAYKDNWSYDDLDFPYLEIF